MLCATYDGLVPARFITVVALDATGELEMGSDGRFLGWTASDGARPWQLELNSVQPDRVDRPMVTKVQVEERSAILDVASRFAGRFWPELNAHT